MAQDEDQRPPAPPPSPMPCSRRKPQPCCFLLQQLLGFLHVPEPWLPQLSQSLRSSWSPHSPISQSQALPPLAPGTGATHGPSTTCGQVCCGTLPWVGGHCRGHEAHPVCAPQPGHGTLPWLRAIAWPWGTTLLNLGPAVRVPAATHGATQPHSTRAIPAMGHVCSDPQFCVLQMAGTRL